MPEPVAGHATYRPTDFESYQPDSCHADGEGEVEQPNVCGAPSSLERREPVESSSAASALASQYLKSSGT